jgi:hypothetical protein
MDSLPATSVLVSVFLTDDSTAEVLVVGNAEFSAVQGEPVYLLVYSEERE